MPYSTTAALLRGHRRRQMHSLRHGTQLPDSVLPQGRQFRFQYRRAAGTLQAVPSCVVLQGSLPTGIPHRAAVCALPQLPLPPVQYRFRSMLLMHVNYAPNRFEDRRRALVPIPVDIFHYLNRALPLTGTDIIRIRVQGHTLF